MIKNNKTIEYKYKVLECLTNELFGLTIIDLTKKISGNRNTVSKYLSILEAEGLVFKENIGTASVYFAKERKSLPFDLVLSFYKALLGAIKNELPNQEEIVKAIGKKMADYPFFPFQIDLPEEFLKIDQIKNYNIYELSTQKFRQYFEYFFLRIDPKDTIITIEKNRMIYRMNNSELLEDHGDYLYHYYLIAGFFEKKLSELFGMDINCNIREYKTSKKNENNYIVMEFEYPLNKLENIS